jgi:hypothetical protein
LTLKYLNKTGVPLAESDLSEPDDLKNYSGGGLVVPQLKTKQLEHEAI